MKTVKLKESQIKNLIREYVGDEEEFGRYDLTDGASDFDEDMEYMPYEDIEDHEWSIDDYAPTDSDLYYQMFEGNSINEKMYKNVPMDDDIPIEKMNGRIPKTMKARMNRIYRIVSKYGIDSRLYSDDHWQALSDYKKVIESLGCDFSAWCDNGGYTDYSKEDNMPRSKVYNVLIEFEDGMEITGYIKMMAAGSVEDPFSKYDTCMVLWKK